MKKADSIAVETSDKFNEEVKHALHILADDAEKLAHSLGITGEPLREVDLQLIRLAMFPRIKEHAELLEAAFVTGHRDSYEYHLEQLHQMADHLR